MIDIVEEVVIEMCDGNVYMYDKGVIESYSMISTPDVSLIIINTFDGSKDLYHQSKIKSVSYL